MFRTRKLLSDHETRLASLSLAVAELRRDHDRTANAELLKLIQQLQDDLDATRISLRSLHGKVAIQKRLVGEKERDRTEIPTDEEFQRVMELQQSFGGTN